MLLSRRSALLVFVIAFSVLVILFGMPTVTRAVEAGPDWINGTVSVAKISDYQWVDGDESRYNNVPCQYITANTWAWQDNGWTRWKVKSSQTSCLTAGASAYMSWRGVVPFGSDYVQSLNLSDYYNAFTYANPGTDGLALMTNAYAPYANIATELYYTSDVLETFNQLSKDGVGNIVRSPSKPFTHKLTYPDGRTFDLHVAGNISYSANGRWMYLNVRATGQLRINTDDFSVFSFGSGITPSYSFHTAVSNSGNTVATHSYDQGLKVYDLTRCQSEKPEYASRSCTSRDLTQTVRSALLKTLPDPTKFGWWSAYDVKFTSESRLSLLVNYLYDGKGKYSFITVSTEAGPVSTRYLALGDSFSSGEGAYDYRSVTNFYADENNYNLCHQSRSSYSYLLKESLSPEWFGSVACSGAVQRDITDPSNLNYLNKYPQAQISAQNKTEAYVGIVQENIFPGYIPQISLVKKYTPTVATISVGGNDIGFGDIVTACIVNKFFKGFAPCSASRFDREQVANAIDAQIPQLAATFRSVKQNLGGDQKLYVVGYPKIVNYNSVFCSLNTPMDQNEREFADNLVDYLNEAVRIAAAQAGARFLDMSSAFVDSDHDYRLCGNDEQKAVNGLMTESASSRKPGEPIARESFHPNKLGQSLMAQQIRMLTNDFSLQMPQVVMTSSVPDAAHRTRLVGDSIITNPNQSFNYITDSIPNLIINTGIQTLKTIHDAPGTIVQNVTATVELHSTPVTIGQATIKTDNTITATVSIPSSVSPGYHQLHILYTDSTGQAYDLYKYVLVVASADDYDADGVANDAEACVFGDGSATDSDKDGIDDACDGEYVRAVKDESTDSEKEVSQQGITKVPSADDTQATTNESQSSDGAMFESYVFAASTAEELNITDTLAIAPAQFAAKKVVQSEPKHWDWRIVLTGTATVLVLTAAGWRSMVVKRQRLR